MFLHQLSTGGRETKPHAALTNLGYTGWSGPCREKAEGSHVAGIPKSYPEF